ncbi:MAG TPA: alpha/beta hydrolase [Candidatus Acidoferrales bacterium]|nr:alpha/beta hydrolase [Candidatus Acidoferrales bacterium]
MTRFIFSIVLVFLFTDFYNQKTEVRLEYEKKTFVYKIIGQDSIRSDFYRISDDTIARPIIVWIHGGAFVWGSRNSLPKEQLEFYLDAGYSVLSIDYRLAPETKLCEIIADIKDAIIWVQNNGARLQIDPKRIFVIGHSAGGYLALMTGYILDNPPRAIVSFYGYGDIQSEWCNRPDSFYVSLGMVTKEKAFESIRSSVITSASSNERSDLYVYCRQQGIWTSIISGRDPVKEPKYFDRLCPVKNITSIFPPVLLIHGDKDTDVPFQQSILMDEALSQKNIDHQFIRMAGLGHAFDKLGGGLSNNQISNTFHEVIRFMDKYK